MNRSTKSWTKLRSSLREAGRSTWRRRRPNQYLQRAKCQPCTPPHPHLLQLYSVCTPPHAKKNINYVRILLGDNKATPHLNRPTKPWTKLLSRFSGNRTTSMTPKAPLPVPLKHIQPGRKLSALYSAAPKTPTTTSALYCTARKTLTIMVGSFSRQACYAPYEPTHQIVDKAMV